MSLADYENELLESSKGNCESVFQRVADSYEDDLLEFNCYPDDYFEFFLRLLSEERFFGKPGLWNFFLVVGTESHKLSSKHYEKIADCILSNFLRYHDKDLCLAVCDFFARNYEHDMAEKLLSKIKRLEKEKAESSFADDGLRILSNERRRSRGTKRQGS